MEVHLRGVSEYLRPESLKKQLVPIMADLNIPEHEFACEKYYKQKWANITFLTQTQGQDFLKKHGQQQLPVTGSRSSTVGSIRGPNQRPRYKPRLHLMGNEVFCTMSKPHSTNTKAVLGQPNPITLRGLHYAREEKAKPTRKIEKETAPNVFEVGSLACGHNVFDGGRLVFIPETECTDAGIAKFTKKILLIKLMSGLVVRISLDTIAHLVYGFHQLTMTLSEVPSFFREHGSMDQAVNQLIQKVAAVTLGESVPTESTRTRVRNLGGRHAHIVGHCMVYQLIISGADLAKKLKSLSRHESLPLVYFPLVTQQTPPTELGHSQQAIAALMAQLNNYERDKKLPFGVLFQLQALAYNAYLHPGIVLNLTQELCRVHKSDQLAGRRLISIDALKLLFKQCSWAAPHVDPSEFEVGPIIDLLRHNEDRFCNETALREGLVGSRQNKAYIHRVTVTPSRITLHGPEPEAMNRILRKFPNHHEYFIRVQFCDENGQDLFFHPRINYDEVWTRFKTVLSDGIQIAGRTYSFLGFSHSSLRSHSAWFSAPFVDDHGNFQTYFSIIKALGNFSKIRSPAKCAARIGQAFSETPFSLSLDEYGIRVENIRDVTSTDGNRVFSDGVGSISMDVVQDIWTLIPQRKAAPTAFQIRLQGSKGMLALDSTLTGSQVRLRPSMTKFESHDSRNLEICDMASKPIALVLNRQMIKILEDMGTDTAWFLSMQNIELQRLREVTADPYSVADFLRHKNVGESIRLHRLFRQAADMNIDWRKDSFLRSVVEAMVLRDLRLLKHKARIPVSKGITLFGIMDETGLLQEGQVYVTYDFSSSGNRYEPPPVDGQTVIVTRSPALHPGDIQLAVNIIPPQGHPLRRLCNVIIFSQHGQRDLPSQLSGGDLDGDIYNIIWDARAIPKKTFSPADYPRVEALDLGREVTKDDMANFFVDFIKMDCLGVIATRHMILADQMEEGTNHKDCRTLAQLHSTAVDFSKSGKGVSIKELPKAQECRPDFLAPGPETRIVDKSAIELDDYIVEPAVDDDEDQFAGKRYTYYSSNKVLGRLYRGVNEQKIWKEDVQSKVPPLHASFWDEFIQKIRPRYEALTGETGAWTGHLSTAHEIRNHYEDAVSSAMAQYSEHPIKPITELEVFIGNILNRSGVQTSRQRDNSIKLADDFERIAVWITKQMRRVSSDPDVPLTGYQTQFDNLHLCVACVQAGGKENHAGTWQKGRGSTGMQSFRVVAACALLAELRTFDVRVGDGRGGGFVGVRGGGSA